MVYVDDIVVAHRGIPLDWFIKGFTGPKGFNSKHLGKLNWFLGIAVDKHDNGSITINQEMYVSKMVEKFCPNFKAYQVRNAPCRPYSFQKLKEAQSDVEKQKASNLPSLQLIGSLL